MDYFAAKYARVLADEPGHCQEDTPRRFSGPVERGIQKGLGLDMDIGQAQQVADFALEQELGTKKQSLLPH